MQYTLHQILVRAIPRQLLSIAKEGDSTTSPDKLLKSSVTLTVKN